MSCPDRSTVAILTPHGPFASIGPEWKIRPIDLLA